MSNIINSIKFIKKNGLYLFIKECYFRFHTNFYEMYFNVNTKGCVQKEDLGLNGDDFHEYEASGYIHLFNILDNLPVDKNASTFLDYGCGKGRVIVAAASYPFKKIIGIELSNLIDVCQDNIDNMKHRATDNIELKQCDATEFNIPSDVNVIYFFNPFHGHVLEAVIKNIYSSYISNPRKIYIIYLNCDHFDKLIAHENWLTKISQTEVFQTSCSLYETHFCT